MKKIVLDTRRSQVVFADKVEQDGDNYIVLRGAVKRTISADKVAYIEDCEDGADVRATPPTSGPERTERTVTRPAPDPVMSNVPPQIKLPSAFATAVHNNLRSAPPPEPFDDSPPGDQHQVSVELVGSASGTFAVLTDEDSYSADHVREKLVGNIFGNAELKDALRQHNVVGIVKKGNLVTLDCRAKAPVQTAGVSANVASLVNNLVGLVSPVTKLPDLPLDGVLGENTSK